MYLRHLHVQNVKLLRDVEIDFVDAQGNPRMWTVFVGENRLCKTTLLQTIAVAASGRDKATHIATDVIESWPDLRRLRPNGTRTKSVTGTKIDIEATFGFSPEGHAQHTLSWLTASPAPPILHSRITLDPGRSVFDGGSFFDGDPRPSRDPLMDARRENLPGGFVAGYGASRLLRAVGSTDTQRRPDPSVDRLRPLFGADLIGTGFVELLREDLARGFAKVLQEIFVEGGLLPAVTALELRGRGEMTKTSDLIDSQRFEMDIVGDDGKRIRVPATWLSQGYQSIIAWLADVVGQILLEAGELVPAAEMEGVVLVDEIDLHLHPTWQVHLIPALKRVFPRLQFIATTHSPMVLPALTADEVYLLSRDAEGSVVVKRADHSPALLTGSEILESFFSIRTLYPNELGDKVSEYGRLANDPTRSADDDQRMRALRQELVTAGIEYDWEPAPREAVG
jgi:AAA domain, putative AbiEii toxin, Type IV TA system